MNAFNRFVNPQENFFNAPDTPNRSMDPLLFVEICQRSSLRMINRQSRLNRF